MRSRPLPAFIMSARNIKLDTRHDQPSQEALELPFYNLLPKDPVELMKARIAIRERCLEDIEFRNDILAMCQMDVVFFGTVFCWIHETRELGDGKRRGGMPFRPWNDQVDLLAWLQKYGGRVSISVEKTRGIGVSWVSAVYVMWCWLFKEDVDIAVVTKDATTLDIRDRPATYMGKLDFLFKHMPYWIQNDKAGKSILHRTVQNHRFAHRHRCNSVLGFTADDEKLRGGRYYVVIIDEGAFLPNDTQRFLAASQFVSPSRIWISTHNGSNNFFYRMTVDDKSKLVRISTWWWENEDRRKGLYRVTAGQVQLLDPDYKYEAGYEFGYDHPNILRSKWFDDELREPGANIDVLLEELNGVAAIQGRKFFREASVRMIENTCSPPLYIGHILENGEWHEDPEGPWRLWFNPEAAHFRATLGCDPAVGLSHGAYSGIAAIDNETGQQLLGAALQGVDPVQFARLAYAACILLGGSMGPGAVKINWETTGAVGAMFGKELDRMRAPNCWKDETGKVGYHKRDDGEQLFWEVERAVRESELRIQDRRVLDDLELFEYNREFELEFAGTNGHGDLGIALAVAWTGARDARRAFLKPTKTHKINVQGPAAELYAMKQQARRNLRSPTNRLRRYGY